MTETEVASQYLFGWRLYVVIACLFFGSFLIAIDTNIINIAVPRISSDFHSLGDIAWYGTAYLLTLTAFQPIFGSCYKYFRIDIVYFISIIIFEGKGFFFFHLPICNYNDVVYSGLRAVCSRRKLSHVHLRTSDSRVRCCRRSSGRFKHHRPGRCA